jgi:hypothetical protein
MWIWERAPEQDDAGAEAWRNIRSGEVRLVPHGGKPDDGPPERPSLFDEDAEEASDARYAPWRLGDARLCQGLFRRGAYASRKRSTNKPSIATGSYSILW